MIQPYAGISLDMSRMDKILQINGMSGPLNEGQLRATVPMNGILQLSMSGCAWGRGGWRCHRRTGCQVGGFECRAQEEGYTAFLPSKSRPVDTVHQLELDN